MVAAKTQPAKNARPAKAPAEKAPEPAPAVVDIVAEGQAYTQRLAAAIRAADQDIETRSAQLTRLEDLLRDGYGERVETTNKDVLVETGVVARRGRPPGRPSKAAVAEPGEQRTTNREAIIELLMSKPDRTATRRDIFDLFEREGRKTPHNAIHDLTKNNLMKPVGKGVYRLVGRHK
jgi:hypothetical protein